MFSTQVCELTEHSLLLNSLNLQLKVISTFIKRECFCPPVRLCIGPIYLQLCPKLAIILSTNFMFTVPFLFLPFHGVINTNIQRFYLIYPSRIVSSTCARDLPDRLAFCLLNQSAPADRPGSLSQVAHLYCCACNLHLYCSFTICSYC